MALTKKDKKVLKKGFVTLLIALGTWIVFKLAFKGFEGLVKLIGVTSEVGILLVMLFFIVIFLSVFFGRSVKEAIFSVLKR